MGTTEGTDTDDLSDAMRRLADAPLPPHVRSDVDTLLLWARQALAFMTIVHGTSGRLQAAATVVDLAAVS